MAHTLYHVFPGPYFDIGVAYGLPLDFEIENHAEHPADWQRASGDPHGQGAPSSDSNETLCWDFAGTIYHNMKLHLWTSPG